MECGVVEATLRDSVLSSAPTLLEWPCQEQRGSGLIPPHRCRTFPLLLAQMVWPFLQPVSEAQKNKPSIMLSCNAQSIDLPMSTWLTILIVTQAAGSL